MISNFDSAALLLAGTVAGVIGSAGGITSLVPTNVTGPHQRDALWLLRPDFSSTFTRGVQRYVGTPRAPCSRPVRRDRASWALHVVALGDHAERRNLLVHARQLRHDGRVHARLGRVVSALAGIPELHAAVDRVLDTSLGAIIALGSYLLWPTWDQGEVSNTVADVIDAARRYAAVVLGCWLDPEQADRDAIERLRTEARVIRTNTEATLARSIAEPASSPAGLDPDVAAGLLAARRRVCDGRSRTSSRSGRPPRTETIPSARSS